MLRPSSITLLLSLAPALLVNPAFGQKQPPPKLSTIFHGSLSTHLAAGDTLAVSITQNGVVPIYSSSTTIEPGEWISIYGSNLAAGTTSWNGNFPTVLGGTSVMIDNKPAYLWVVTPGQINAQVPDDSARGTVAVQVNTSGGSASSTVTLGDFGPSFSVLDGKYVTGEILRSDGSGAFGGGTYDIVGPAGTSFGFKTVPAKAGDVIELFGVGFGPTSPSFPAGQAIPAGQYGTVLSTNPVQIIINGVTVTPSFVGIIEAGLYQLNITIPGGLGTGDVPIQAMAGGLQTPTGIFISLQ